MSAYLFVHFVDTQEDATREQIYFSVSKDGKTWTTLNNKQPYLTSNVGTQGVVTRIFFAVRTVSSLLSQQT